MKTHFSRNDVISVNFSTSFEAKTIIKKLQTILGFDYQYEVVRLAIGISLGENSSLRKKIDISGHGIDIRGNILFNENDLDLWIGLLVTNYFEYNNDDLTIQKLQSFVKMHISNGSLILNNILALCNNDINAFWNKLLRYYSNIPESVNTKNFINNVDIEKYNTGAINIILGTIKSSKESTKFTHILNGANYSPHIAIMGQAGTGKTRLMKSILKQIRNQTNAPIIILDLGKGDLGQDKDLLNFTKAKVISVPEYPIPLDMFYVSDFLNESESIYAMETFRDAFSEVCESKLGAKQSDNIREALLPLFSSKNKISFDDIKNTLDDFYSSSKLSTDSVISTINTLTLRKLFEPLYSPKEFFNKNWIITFANARKESKKFTVCLLLSALDYYMKNLQETNIDRDHNRDIRLTLAIDEARELLNMNHLALSSNIRLHRSKGLSVILASQSPDDYDGKKDNYLENIGLPICLKTNSINSKIIKNIFHGDFNLSSLKPQTCITSNPTESKTSIVDLEFF